jgi:hypothetical protein|nr:MAG TPA: hypothetical protein [Caudoviricetes sp.]
MTRFEIIRKILPNIWIDENTGYPISCTAVYDSTLADAIDAKCDVKCGQCKRDFWETEIGLTDSEEKPSDSEKIFTALNDIYARLEQLETLIRISNPINVTGAPSNRIPDINPAILNAIRKGERE